MVLSGVPGHLGLTSLHSWLDAATRERTERSLYHVRARLGDQRIGQASTGGPLLPCLHVPWSRRLEFIGLDTAHSTRLSAKS